MRKRRAAVALALAAGAAAGAAHATSPPIIGGPIGTPGTAATTVVLSSSRAAARPVTLTVKLGAFPIICGRPRGSFVVTFPAAEQLPKAIAAEAVHVFTSAANLGNPMSAGTYALTVRHGTQQYHAELKISA